MPVYDDTLPQTIPDTLTWEQAMVLLYHFREGKKTNTHWVRWANAERDIRSQFGFSFYEAADKLIESFDPPLLLYEADKREKNQHRLPRYFFRNPKPLFDAINAAENRHNAAVDKYEAASAADRKLMRNPGKRVPITPHEAGRAFSSTAPTAPAPAAPTLNVGDLISTPQGPARVVMGDNGPEVELLPVKGAKTAPAADTPPPSDPPKGAGKGSRKDSRKGTKPKGATTAPAPKPTEAPQVV